MLEPIPKDHEKLSINNFLLFNETNISLGNITAIIGPQASGKSIISKLIFFGRQYLSRFLTENINNNFSLKTFKRKQIAEFRNTFDLNGYTGEFDVEYSFSNLCVRIVRGNNGSRIEIFHADSLDNLSDKVRTSYIGYLLLNETQPRELLGNPTKFRKDEKEFFDTVPDTIFVPASRSFYSTVSDELFTFLASEERVDPITAQFGSFYEFARRRLSHEFGRVRNGSASDAQKAMRPVLMGDFIRAGSRDYIQTKWGRVQLSFASSGQQEVLPLLLTLLEFPSKIKRAQQLIIEEPEAHLFPAAQKYILDFMVTTAKDNLCDMLFTTHSPYVIACLNNHIARKMGKNEYPTFTSYFTEKGTAVDITDEDGYIDANCLDSVSQTIADEFLRAIE